MKIFTLIAILASFGVQASDKYWSKSSYETMLTYRGRIEGKLYGNVTLSDLQSNTDAREEALELVYEQVPHLIGHFSSETFLESFGYPGVLGEKYDIKFTSVKKIRNGRYLLGYSFKGKAVFHRGAFGGKKKIKVPLRLPLAVDKIYDLGVRNGFNYCTDEHYNSEGDFFYFWDPDKSGCPLKGNSKDVVRVDGTVSRLKSTYRTYPEYDRLYQKDELNLMLFIGYVDEIESYSSVPKGDSAYDSFEEIIKKVKLLGFKQTKSQDKGIAQYREFTKIVQNGLGKKQTVRFKVLISDTELSGRPDTFHQYLRNSYLSDDIIMYDGHSGLGGNLSLELVSDLGFNKNKYQLIFFNGCSSYPYFNGTYFRAHGGSKNLDIITSGLSTYSSTATDNMWAYFYPFLNGEVWSYQEIVGEIEDSNNGENPYLTGVNGDEDNVFQP